MAARPPCEFAGRNEMDIVEIVRCSRHTLWRFCGVWYCDSLQCHKKTKIRSLAKHNVLAVLLTPLQGESQRTENPAIKWAIHYFLSDSGNSSRNFQIGTT